MYMAYHVEKEKRVSLCVGTIDWWLGKDKGKGLGEGSKVLRGDIWLKERAEWWEQPGLEVDGVTKFKKDSNS